MTGSKPRVRTRASTVKSDPWAFRRPLGTFIALFILSLAALAFYQPEPITWLNVSWAAVFAFVMTTIEELFRRKRRP